MVKRREIESETPDVEVTSVASVVGQLTPAQLFAVTALAIFAGEALVMFIIPLFTGLPVGVVAVLDSTMLTVFTAPFLYFFLFRPIVRHAERRKRAELALMELNRDLEHRVEERTRELTLANKALHREVQERRATEDRIRRTNDFVQRLVESAPCVMATVDATTLKCNYINGRIEDFLGHSPDDVALSGGAFLDSIIDPTSSSSYHEMVDRAAAAPDGEIVRGLCRLRNATGVCETYRMGIVVVSRTEIGEAAEVLVMAIPADDDG